MAKLIIAVMLAAAISGSSAFALDRSFEREKPLLLLTNEFIDLENRFSPMKPNVLLKNFTSLRTRIKDYVKRQSPTNDQDKIVLSRLNAAVMSKICAIKYDPEVIPLKDGFLLDIKYGLESAMDSIKLFKLQGYVEASQENFQKYNQFFEEKFKQELIFVRDMVMKDLNTTYEKIVNNMTPLKTNHSDSSKQLLLKKSLSAVNFSAGFLSFLVSLGAAAGVNIGGTAKGVQNFFKKDQISNSTDESADFLIAVSDFTKYITTKLEEKSKFLKAQLEFTKTEVKNSPEDKKVLVGIKDILSKLEPTLLVMKTRTNSSDLKIMVETIPLMIDLKRRELEEHSNKTVEFLEIEGHVDKLIFSEVIVEEKMKNFRKLEDFEAKLSIKLADILDRMVNNFTLKHYNVSGESHAFADVRRWGVQKIILELERDIFEVTKSLRNESRVLDDSLIRLREGMKVTLDMFNQLEYHQDEVILAALLKDIDHKTTIDNLKMQDKVNILNSVILSSTILKHYKFTLKQFKDFMFPVAPQFLDRLDRYSWPRLRINDSSTMVEEAIGQIEKLKYAMEYDDAVLRHYKSYTVIGVFGESSSPFYSWDHESLKLILPDLLSGKEVTLDADVARAPKWRDAVKFNRIELRFKLENATAQKKFDKVFVLLAVEATHLGNARYKVCDKYYSVSTPKMNIRYTNYKDSFTKVPEIRNEVYDMLASHKALLSPYATWSLKIRGSLSHRRFSELTGLEKFGNEPMSLELVGKGRYVEKGVSEVCNSMDNFYNSIEP